MVSDKSKPEPLTIGDTIKKTINKTLVIGVAFTAAVILTPAAFARDAHPEPAPRPSNGIQLAADIVNLVRAIVEPLPAPVVVAPPEPVVTKEVVTKEVVTVPGAVIVTETETEIPEYSYILYEDEYIPYYEGWLYYRDVWHWVGAEPRPAAPPKWAPPHRPGPDHHKVIVLDHGPKPAPVVIRREPPHHAPAPVVIRREPPHHAPAPVVVRREAPRHEPPFAIHHEARRPEPARTVVVTTGKKPAAPAKTVAVADRKPAGRADTPRNAAPKKGR